MLFVDFDGVLHPRPAIDRNTETFCALGLLQAVLRHAPEVDVVISSSWREHHSIDEMREYFAEDLRHRIASVTPIARQQQPNVLTCAVAHTRYNECTAWLAENRASGTPWVALDGTAEEFPPGCAQLVLVDGTQGLTSASAAVLHARLHQHLS